MITEMNLLLALLALLLAFPIGYLLAWLTRDELVAGRKWFWLLILLSLIIFLLSFFIKNPNIKNSIIFTIPFFIITCLISIHKSYDKKFLKK